MISFNQNSESNWFGHNVRWFNRWDDSVQMYLIWSRLRSFGQDWYDLFKIVVILSQIRWFSRYWHDLVWTEIWSRLMWFVQDWHNSVEIEMIQSSLSWFRQLLQDCRSFCRDIEWRKTNVGYYVEYWRICEILWY